MIYPRSCTQSEQTAKHNTNSDCGNTPDPDDDDDDDEKGEPEEECLLPAEETLFLPTEGGYGGGPSASQVPIAGALFVATCLGTPVIALTGLKLGMFAAVGGGIMGFATGKMFAEHE